VTVADALRPESTLEGAARMLQVALAVLVGYGAAVGNPGLLVNGVLAFVVTFVPTVLEWRYDHHVDPRLDLWIAIAALLHGVGFLGLYDVQSGPLSWYDQVAHAISASFVAGVAYTVLVAFDVRSSRVNFPEEFRFAFTVLFVAGFGVAWEILEFAVTGVTSALGSRGILIQYGKDDIVFDIVFNTLAGVAVALWGTRYFADITDIVARRVLGRGRS